MNLGVQCRPPPATVPDVANKDINAGQIPSVMLATPPRLTAAASLATLFLLAGLAPASACHATNIDDVFVGVIAPGGVPTPATIGLGTCEGTVSVTVTPLGGTPDTFDAQFDLQGDSVLGTECLFNGGCSPFYPPAAVFTLSSVDRDMALVGTMGNALHAAFVITLTGTYLDAPATFEMVIA